MAYKDLRGWLETLEEAGELKRVTAEVDWNLELSAIALQIRDQEGPALLFENIKGYRDAWCSKVFINGMASRRRVAMALGLASDTPYRSITEFVKERLGQQMAPVIVNTEVNII